MSQNVFKKDHLTFSPELGLLRISQRKIRRFLGWIFYGFLILVALYGLLNLFYFLVLFFSDSREDAFAFWEIFNLSLLSEMILFYIWQRKKERVKKINPQEHALSAEKGGQIEVSNFLDDSAKKALEKAWLLCHRKGYHYLRPIHLFASFLGEENFNKILKRLDCQPKKVSEKTNRILGSVSFFPESEKGAGAVSPEVSSDFKEIFFDAYLFSLKQEDSQISSLDILWAISQQDNLVGMIFDEFGISSEEIAMIVEWAYLEGVIEKREKEFFWKRLFKPKGKMNRSMTAALTPLLDKISIDMTYLAKEGQFEMIIGREKEIEEIFDYFSTGRSGLVLVGESEVGKKAVVKKLAQLMVEEKVPRFLKDKRLVKLELGSLVGLSESRQKGEEYLKQVLFEVARAGNIVLVVENADRIVGLKSQPGGLDFSEILASGLEGGKFFFIGTSSTEKHSLKIEHSSLGHLLGKVAVVVPPRETLWQVLATKAFLIEQELKIVFSADALVHAIDLGERFFYGKSLTARAMDLLVEAGYLVRRQRGKGSLVKDSDVISLVSQKAEIPLGQLQEPEREKLLQLESLIHQRMVDQEEAVKAVADALRRSRLHDKGRERTICNFLFVGPTGVGKTELAKTLSRVYFGDVKKMIRLDMSEYQEKRSLRRLVGLRTDQGTVKGFLTEAIKRQPYALLLLDEIEKAHPDILNVFLQVMDDGRMTDASGETINFSNVILIATSNAGTQFVQDEIKKGLSYQKIFDELKNNILLEFFKPEFINRFDRVVLFKVLAMDQIAEIAKIFLREVRSQIESKGIILEVEREALEELAQAGYDPLYGARPLRRVIQDKVEDVLARLFLEGKLERRDKAILRKGLVFEIIKGPKI